jgi:hypothetical protein
MGRLDEWRDARARMNSARQSWRSSRFDGMSEDYQRNRWEEYQRVVRLAPPWLRGRHVVALRNFPGT